MDTVSLLAGLPVALIIGSLDLQLQQIAKALEQAGYALYFPAPDIDLAQSKSAQHAAIAVFQRDDSNTAILNTYRYLKQRPALIIVEPAGALLAVGFDPLPPGPYPPEDLVLALRYYRAAARFAAETIITPLPTPAPSGEVGAVREPATSQAPDDDISTPEDEAAAADLFVVEDAAPAPDADTPAPSGEVGAVREPPTSQAPDAAPAPSGEVGAVREPPTGRVPAADAFASDADAAVAPAPSGVVGAVRKPRWQDDRIRLIAILVLVIFVGGSLVVFSQINANSTTQAPTVVPTTRLAEVAMPVPSVAVTPQPTIQPSAPSPLPSPLPLATIVPTSQLEVNIIDISPAEPVVGDVVVVQIEVRNTSTEAITQPFWIDLYVSPSSVPVRNIAWSDISSYGATWRINGIGAGEILRINSLDADPARSNLLSFPNAGVQQLYVLADTFNETQRNESFATTVSPLVGPVVMMVKDAP